MDIQDTEKAPFISIIIPVFNMEEGIRHCLESVAGQASEDVEVVVVDDGSTDGSAGVIEGYSASHPSVRCIRQQNSGVSAARNRGLAEARGEYVMFVDADDEIEEGYLSRIAHKAASTQADMLFWGITRCFPDGHTERWEPSKEGLMDRKGFLSGLPSMQYGRQRGLYGFVSNKLIRKSIIDGFGLHFDTSMSLMEDYGFFLDCYPHCSSFYCFPETGYRYRLYDTAGSQRTHREVSYRQMIEVHTKCARLLEAEGLMTGEKRYAVDGAIGVMALSMFRNLEVVNRDTVKSAIDYVHSNAYCIAALKEMSTRWRALRCVILSRNVPATVFYVRMWKLYMSFRTKGKE